MRCPQCGHEFANPTAQAGGRAGGAAKVAKGFAVVGQPSAAARKRGWKKRKRPGNLSLHPDCRRPRHVVLRVPVMAAGDAGSRMPQPG